MNDPANPFTSPSDPAGSWHLPPEDFAAVVPSKLDPNATFDGLTYAYAAAAVPGLGGLAVIRFQFSNSALRRIVPMDFIADPATVTRLGSDLAVAASRAAAAARRLS